MKTLNAVVKVLAVLAAVAGAIYVIAAFGDKIVAWAKRVIGCCPWDEGMEEEAAPEAAEEETAAPAEEAAAAETPAEAPAEEEAAPAARDNAPVASDEDACGGCLGIRFCVKRVWTKKTPPDGFPVRRHFYQRLNPGVPILHLRCGRPWHPG